MPRAVYSKRVDGSHGGRFRVGTDLCERTMKPQFAFVVRRARLDMTLSPCAALVINLFKNKRIRHI